MLSTHSYSVRDAFNELRWQLPPIVLSCDDNPWAGIDSYPTKNWYFVSSPRYQNCIFDVTSPLVFSISCKSCYLYMIAWGTDKSTVSLLIIALRMKYNHGSVPHSRHPLIPRPSTFHKGLKGQQDFCSHVHYQHILDGGSANSFDGIRTWIVW